MGTDARGVFWYAILYCGLLLVLAPLSVAAGVSLKADAMCTAGNYTCPYGSQPPQGQSGPCMLKKYCFDVPAPNMFVHGECIKLNDCLGTSYTGQDGKTHPMDTDTKKQLDFLRSLQPSSSQTSGGGQATPPSDSTPSATSPSDIGTQIDGAFDPLGGEPLSEGLKSGESILQQVEKYIDPLGREGEPDFSGPEGAPSGRFSSPDLDNAVSQTSPPSSRISFPGQETPEAPYTAESTFERPPQAGQEPPDGGGTSESQSMGDSSNTGIVCADNPSSCPSSKTGDVSWYNCGTGGSSGPCVGTRDNKIDPRDYTVASAFPDNTVLKACTKATCVAVVANDKGKFLNNREYSGGNRVGDLSPPAFRAIADPKLGLEQGVIEKTTLSPIGMYSDYATAKAVASSINNSMVYDFYGESIGSYDIADASLQNYNNDNYFSTDNTDAWNAVALNDNNANFFYGDNAAEFSEVAANDKLFSNNLNTADLDNFAPADQLVSHDQISQDIADQQAVNAFNAQPDSWPEPTYVFENPYAISPEEQQAFIEQDSRAIVANDQAARSSPPDIDWSAVAHGWEGLAAESAAQNADLAAQDTLDNFDNPLIPTADEQQQLVNETSRSIVLADEQRIAEYRAQSILNNFYNPLVPTDSQRQALVDDMSRSVLNDANLDSFAPADQLVSHDQISQDIADQQAVNALNAQYDAELPEPQMVDKFELQGVESKTPAFIGSPPSLGLQREVGDDAKTVTTQPIPKATVTVEPARPKEAAPETKTEKVPLPTPAPEPKTPVPLPTPAPQPKEVTPPTPPETKDVPPPPARPPTATQPKIIAPATPTQPPVPTPLPRPQIRPPADSTPQGETPGTQSDGGGIGEILGSLGQMLGKFFGGGGGGGAAGQTFAQNTFCVTNLDPMVVRNIPAGTPFPSNCYNNPLNEGVPLAPRPQAPAPQSPAPAPAQPRPATPDDRSPTPTQNPSALTPVVSIIANPSIVAMNGITTLAWSSVGTTKCTVSAPNGAQIGASVSDGKATSTALATSTTFAILCTTATGGTVSGQTTVKVKVP